MTHASYDASLNAVVSSMSEHNQSAERGKVERAAISRVQVSRKTVEVHRPTVEVSGQPLSEGFPVVKIALTVTEGADVGLQKTFDKSTIRIGADPLSDIVLTDQTVSRMHAEIRARGDLFELADMESTNGTFVDGSRVSLIELPSGAEFQVGRTKMRVETITEQIPIPVTDRTRYGGIIGQSQALREIFSILDRVAPSELSVVIEGETGTGKGTANDDHVVVERLHEGVWLKRRRWKGINEGNADASESRGTFSRRRDFAGGGGRCG